MTGLLLVDKPEGLSSHDVVRQVRRLAGTRRVGHAGTLDPLATGVLLVALGDATRLVEFLMEGDKSYRACMELGVVTDTQDCLGQVLERRPVPSLDEATLRAAAARFVGEIDQIPPMYSALKRNVQPLYKLAREGKTVERQPRRVTISRLEISTVALPRFELDIDCSKGTYIRTLCHDLGAALGPGGHMVSLCRTRSGAHQLVDCLSWQQLTDPERWQAGFPGLSLAQMLPDWPALQLGAAAARKLDHGIPPTLAELEGPPDVAPATRVRLLHGNTLRAVACFAPGREREQRGDFELLRVFGGA